MKVSVRFEKLYYYNLKILWEMNLQIVILLLIAIILPPSSHSLGNDESPSSKTSNSNFVGKTSTPSSLLSLQMLQQSPLAQCKRKLI